MPKELRKMLGAILVEAGLINSKQIEDALNIQKETGERLGKILTRMGVINEETLVSFLSEQLGVPFVSLTDYLIDSEIIKLVPEDIARRYDIMPLFKIGDTLTVAMVDPTNVFALDQIGIKTGCSVEPMLSVESEIKKAIDQYYGVTGSMDDIIKNIEEENVGLKAGREIGEKRLQDLVEEAPVIKLVNMIMMQAVKDGASDVHIEPEEDSLRTRFRVDGVLREVSSPPKHLQAAVISRIKIMANLDISERRIPQDGRFHMKIENRNIDFRVSTFPTVYGENVVMRLLDASSVLIGLEKLGFSEDFLRAYRELIRKPYGIILVTGPTGSGKTTTLYSSLNEINSIDKNIITVEDPVEYRIKLIRQSQVNNKAGLTFASGLRAILRQDPDVIMVGEIRDLETAEISIHAALTGHLVFSTLHTNNAPGAMPRLIDMGVEPFLVASSMTCIIAQRLVRKICDACKKTYKPGKELVEELKLSSDKEYTFYKGGGCKSCSQTGYRGRIGLYELLVPNEEIRGLIIAKASADSIKDAAVKTGLRDMRYDGVDKMLQGLTSVEEILRATKED